MCFDFFNATVFVISYASCEKLCPTFVSILKKQTKYKSYAFSDIQQQQTNIQE